MPSEPWTVRKLLEWTTGFFTRKEVDAARLSAELLLSHVLNIPRIAIYTNYDNLVSEKHLAEFKALVQRAAEHEPIAYLTGRAHFFNLEFEVTRDVLIPRPDTETLVENVVQLARNQPGFESPRILDLCTGSGCIAAAIASRVKNATIVATDISNSAIAVAKRNIEKLNMTSRVTLDQGDLYDAIANTVEAQPFDLIVANPPYIPTQNIEKLDKSVRAFEPKLALDGGLDGLTLHRRILDGATDRLRQGGRIYLEIQFDQGPAAKELFANRPDFDDIRILRDYSGNDRVVTATRK